MIKKYILMLMLFMASATGLFAQWGIHPGIPFTRYDLDELKENIKHEPWKSAYGKFSADAHASLNYQMKGPFRTVSRSPHINRNAWLSDIQAVHNLTFMWIFSGNDAFARKATDILDAWAVQNTSWTGDEAILDIGDHAQFYATAADILKSMYPGWTKENTIHINHYFANVLWRALDVPNPVRGANQGADALKAAVGIAAFLDDKEKFDQAISAFRNDPAGGLKNSLPNGQVGDSGRDEGHTAGQIWNYSWAAEVAWKQGIDVFSDRDNRLLASAELYSRYNQDTTGLKFIPFGNPYGFYDKWGWNGGVKRKNPFYNIISAAYGIRLGKNTPYTDKQRELTGETPETFLFRKTTDPSKAVKLKAEQPFSFLAANKIYSASIGTRQALGGLSNNNNLLKIRGKGNICIPSSVYDTLFFVYSKIKGDAAAMVKINSLGKGNANARIGLMFRESLKSGSKQAGIYLSPGGWARTSWRGAEAFCKTDISWDIRTQLAKNYEEHSGVQAPYWLKIERRKNRVSLYHSFDADHWTCLENVELKVSSSAYLGIALSSGDEKMNFLAECSDFSVGNISR